jgi:hypothetical protein
MGSIDAALCNEGCNHDAMRPHETPSRWRLLMFDYMLIRQWIDRTQIPGADAAKLRYLFLRSEQR